MVCNQTHNQHGKVSNCVTRQRKHSELLAKVLHSKSNPSVKREAVQLLPSSSKDRNLTFLIIWMWFLKIEIANISGKCNLSVTVQHSARTVGLILGSESPVRKHFCRLLGQVSVLENIVSSVECRGLRFAGFHIAAASSCPQSAGKKTSSVGSPGQSS